MLALLASFLVGVSPPAAATELRGASLAPAAPAPTPEATAPAKPNRVTYAAVITGDWQPDRETAWRDARLKAFETALGNYRIVGSSIAIRGPQRRVKLRIEWKE